MRVWGKSGTGPWFFGAGGSGFSRNAQRPHMRALCVGGRVAGLYTDMRQILDTLTYIIYPSYEILGK